MLTWIVMYNIFKADKLKILSVVVARQEGGMNEACSPRRQISSQKGKSVAWQKQYSIVLDDDRLLVLVECKMCQVKICSLSNTSPFSYLFPPSPSMLEASTNDNRPHAYNVTEQIVPPSYQAARTMATYTNECRQLICVPIGYAWIWLCLCVYSVLHCFATRMASFGIDA